MKNVLTIVALLALTGCAQFQTFAPETTEKTVDLTKKGLKTYCDKVPAANRAEIRQNVNTPERGVFAYCSPAELEVIHGLYLYDKCPTTGSYIEELQK
jgi:hypothetical protein